MTKTAIISVTAIVAALAFSSPMVAHADTSTFDFTGTCSDCGANGGAGTATATLVLQNYTLEDDLQSSNFVSFSYTSDLVGTVTAEVFNGLSGVLDNLPGPENVSMTFFASPQLSWDFIFTSSTSSDWGLSTSGGGGKDSGTNLGTWSADPVATPLPATLPLFASGLGALGLLGWRRKRKAQAAA